MSFTLAFSAHLLRPRLLYRHSDQADFGENADLEAKVAAAPAPFDCLPVFAKLSINQDGKRSQFVTTGDPTMGLGIALKAFSAALFDSKKSDQLAKVLAGESSSAPAISQAPPSPKQPAAPAKPSVKPSVQESAITLMATLQREARLVDLIHEDLAQFSDAQVGAAARPCLQQCRSVLDRVMNLQRLVEQEDGETIEVSGDASPQRYQWVGEGASGSGKLIHHGWVAQKVELPKWSGDPSDANVVAPAQVQAS